MGGTRTKAPWSFFSNHGHVFFCIARDQEVRMRDISEQVGITERQVQTIVRDLLDAGYLTSRRRGNRNVYELMLDAPLRHPTLGHQRLRDLITVLRP